MSCDQSTDPNVQNCFGRGNCTLDATNTSYSCVCIAYYRPEIYCEMNRWEFNRGADTVLYSILGVVMLLVCLFLIPEIAIDFRLRRSLTWKTPVVVAKIFLFIFMFPRMVQLFYGPVRESIVREPSNAVLLDVFRVICQIGLAVVYALICIGWINVVLRAKKLGTTNTSLKKFRKFIFILLCILAPIYAVVKFSIYFVEKTPANKRFFDAQQLGSYAIEVVYILSILIGTSVFIVKLWIWTNKNKHDSDIMKRVAIKTTYVAVANLSLVIMLCILIMEVIFAAVARRNPSLVTYLVLDVVFRTLDAIIGVSFFFFLENYFFSYGLLRGYYLGIQGNIDINVTGFTGNPSGPKVPSSRTFTNASTNNVKQTGSTSSTLALSVVDSKDQKQSRSSRKSRNTSSNAGSKSLSSASKSPSSSAVSE